MLNATTSPQLYELSRVIPAKFIKAPPKGKYGSYVPHWVIEQVLLVTVGPFDFTIAKVLRGRVPAHIDADTGEVKHPALEDAVVGVISRIAVVVDGRPVVIEEAGSCEAGAYEWNDAERLKKATSDGLKRCAMRLGVGLHLWCKSPDEYFLPTILRTEAGVGDDEVSAEHVDHVDEEG